MKLAGTVMGRRQPSEALWRSWNCVQRLNREQQGAPESLLLQYGVSANFRRLVTAVAKKGKQVYHDLHIYETRVYKTAHIK